MCHIKPTWHKLPHSTNVDWNIFIYSADYPWCAHGFLKTSKNKEKKNDNTQITFWETCLAAQWVSVYNESVPLPSSSQRATNRQNLKKIDQPNATHVCVFHLRLMMCHIYEVSDSGSLNDRQLSRATHIASVPNGRAASNVNIRKDGHAFRETWRSQIFLAQNFLSDFSHNQHYTSKDSIYHPPCLWMNCFDFGPVVILSPTQFYEWANLQSFETFMQ